MKMTDYIGISSFTVTTLVRGEKSKVRGVLETYTPGWLRQAVSEDISRSTSPNRRGLELRNITEENVKFASSSPQKLIKLSRSTLSPATQREMQSLLRGSTDLASPFHGTPSCVLHRNEVIARLLRAYSMFLSDQEEIALCKELAESFHPRDE